MVRAIETAERELEQQGQLFCLGDIVHNNAEVTRLKGKGLRVIDSLDLLGMRNEELGMRNEAGEQQTQAKVLIRAHGEPPATYEKAKELGISLIDATCPIVLALQQRIRKGYEEMRSLTPQGQVVIFGKPGHAEVIGLCGQTDNTAIVVSSPDDLEGIDFSRPIRLYSQTTKSKEEYQRLIENIKFQVSGFRFQVGPVSGLTDSVSGPTDMVSGPTFFVAYDTICNRVANRATQLEAFAKSVDAVIFVSGKGSSNGHYLYEYCKSVQPRTLLVSDVEELRPDELKGFQRIGITGATSTPRWLMEEVKLKLKSKN